MRSSALRTGQVVRWRLSKLSRSGLDIRSSGDLYTNRVCGWSLYWAKYTPSEGGVLVVSRTVDGKSHHVERQIASSVIRSDAAQRTVYTWLIQIKPDLWR